MNAIGGAIRLLPSGRYQADRSEANGSRLRRNFPTLEAAKAWLLDLHLVRESQAAPLTALEAIQYREAVAALPPGGTLLEAARLLAERRRAAPLMGTTLADVYARHLAERQSANLRARSVNAIRYALAPLVTDFGPRVMSAIQRDELAGWVAARGGSPASRAACRRYVVGLWRYALRVGAVADDVSTSLPGIRMDSRDVSVLTPAQADALVEACRKTAPQVLGALAIGLYAGLRQAEIEGLRWQDVDLERGSIRVTPATAKKRRQRIVDVVPWLAGILRPLDRSGHIVLPVGGRRWYELREKIGTAAGVAITSNVARHSYCSYHLALHRNAAETADQAGNSPAMIYQHYRALVSQDEARAYFHAAPEVTPKASKRRRPSGRGRARDPQNLPR